MAINITLPPYSADPTGATDSTAAINAALAVDSNFGPAGTYSVSSPLNVLRSNTILTGEGTSTIFKTNNPTPDIFCVGRRNPQSRSRARRWRVGCPVVGNISGNTYSGNVAGNVLYGTLSFSGDVIPRNRGFVLNPEGIA